MSTVRLTDIVLSSQTKTLDANLLVTFSSCYPSPACALLDSARNGKEEALRNWLAVAKYTPLTDSREDSEQSTALIESIYRHDYAITSLLLSKLTTYISEDAAATLSIALKILARETPQHCLQFLQHVEDAVTRPLATFRTSMKRTECCGQDIPRLLSHRVDDDLRSKEDIEDDDSAIPPIWVELGVFPAASSYCGRDQVMKKVLMQSKVILLANFAGDERTGQSPFHALVPSSFNTRPMET